MKAQLVQVEKEMTKEELLTMHGLTASMYLVEVDHKLVQGSDTIKAGQTAKIIPAVKGG